MSSVENPYGRRSERRRGLTPVSGRPPARPAPAPVGTTGTALAPYRGETYYELPAVKPSHYNWLIIEYFFVGGLAGSSQVLATVADLTGGRRRRNRSVVRA